MTHRRAIIYTRISQDATGDAAGVDRQRADCERFCVDRGWEVVGVEVDNDISASQYARKARPGYAAVVEAVRSGRADAVVAWHVDRLYRRPRELEDLIDLAERVTIATLSGEFDLSTGDGRLFARQLAAFAAKASDDTSRRLRAKFDDKAAKGLPHGARAFGYEPDGMTVRESEAKWYRQAVADVLAGESLNGIARRWNEAGVGPPQRAKEWNGTTVRATLTSPRHAGLRVHRRAVIGEAAWEPIISRSDHERIVRTLDNRKRSGSHPPRRRAFTGLVRSAETGLPLDYDNVRGRPTYRAHNRPGRMAGNLGIAAGPLEDLVTEAVFQRVEGADLGDRLSTRPTDDGGDELARAERDLDELASMLGAGEISRREWLTVRKGIESRRAAAARRAAKVNGSMALDGLTGSALREAWVGDRLSIDRKRAVLSALIDRIEIAPARRKGGPGIDPERVNIVWRS